MLLIRASFFLLLVSCAMQLWGMYPLDYHEAAKDNIVRMSAVFLPVIATLYTGIDSIYDGAPMGIKKLAVFGVCSLLYTTACLQAYEDYTNRTDGAKIGAVFLMTGGNVVLSNLFLRR